MSKKIESSEELLTIDEAAAAFKIARSLVSRATSNKELPYRQVGRARFVERGDVTTWMKTRFPREAAPPAATEATDGAS